MSIATDDFQPRIEKLTSGRSIAEFDCGVEALNQFLHRYASQNQKKDSAQTWLALIGERVVGYYTLTVGEVTHSESPEGLGKGLPRYPIPVMILARLAVDNRFQGQKLGQGLLLDALRRTVNAADIAGIRAILVHAKDETAGKFYGHFGFEPFPASPLTMYKLLKDIRAMMDRS
jgi:GNAT superfamily N-acetyltransferase